LGESYDAGQTSYSEMKYECIEGIFNRFYQPPASPEVMPTLSRSEPDDPSNFYTRQRSSRSRFRNEPSLKETLNEADELIAAENVKAAQQAYIAEMEEKRKQRDGSNWPKWEVMKDNPVLLPDAWKKAFIDTHNPEAEIPLPLPAEETNDPLAAIPAEADFWAPPEPLNVEVRYTVNNDGSIHQETIHRNNGYRRQVKDRY